MTARRAVLALAAIAALSVAGCEVQVGPAQVVQGSGHVRTESRDVHDFDRVELGGVGSLAISQGSTEGLTIQAEDNLLPKLQSTVVNGALQLRPQPGTAISPTRPIRYQLAVKQLSAISVSGSTDVQASSLSAGQLVVSVTGVGHVNLAGLTASSLTVDVTGTGDVTVAGQVPRQTVTISGTGRYRASNLASQQATVTVTGTGDCDVRVSDHLSVTVSGVGHVSYAGSPTVDEQITGSGSVTRTG